MSFFAASSAAARRIALIRQPDTEVEVRVSGKVHKGTGRETPPVDHEPAALTRACVVWRDATSAVDVQPCEVASLQA